MTTVAVRLPPELVAEVDRLVAGGVYRTRSEAFRTALETLIEAQRRRALDESIITGYTRFPPPEPDAETIALAIRSIEEEAW